MRGGSGGLGARLATVGAGKGDIPRQDGVTRRHTRGSGNNAIIFTSYGQTSSTIVIKRAPTSHVRAVFEGGRTKRTARLLIDAYGRDYYNVVSFLGTKGVYTTT